jgi:MFS family permease
VTVSTEDSRSSIEGAGKSRARIFGIFGITMIGLAMAANNGFFNLLLPNIMEQSPQISASVVEISIVLAIFTLSTGIISPFMSTLGWRKPNKWIIGGLLITTVLYFALSQLHNILQIDFLTFTIGVSTSFITPLALSLLTASVPRKLLGRTMGIYGAIEDVGLIISSSAGSIIWGLYGEQYSFILIGLIFAFVSGVFRISIRKRNLPG